MWIPVKRQLISVHVCMLDDRYDDNNQQTWQIELENKSTCNLLKGHLWEELDAEEICERTSNGTNLVNRRQVLEIVNNFISCGNIKAVINIRDIFSILTSEV